MLRFDPNLRWLFTELPMIDRYAAAAAAGFRGVESAFPYDIPARELASRLTDLNLTLVQVLSPFDWAAGERGLAALPGREADFRDSIERALAYSVEVGRPNVHVMPGNITPNLDRADCMARFIRHLDWAAERAAQAGITLILEPCAKARFPEFLYHRIEEGSRSSASLGATTSSSALTLSMCKLSRAQSPSECARPGPLSDTFRWAMCRGAMSRARAKFAFRSYSI